MEMFIQFIDTKSEEFHFDMEGYEIDGIKFEPSTKRYTMRADKVR